MLGISGKALGALILGLACSGPDRDDAYEPFGDGLEPAPSETPAPFFPDGDPPPADPARRTAPMRQYMHFELGESLLKAGRPVEAEEQFRSFINLNPRSPRLHAAYRHLAAALRHQGRDGEALKLYRAAIERFGDDPANRSVEPLLLACIKLHRECGDLMSLERDLAALCSRARSTGRLTLAARCAWSLARLAMRKCPESTFQTYLGLVRDIPKERIPPAIAIDVAEYLVGAGCRDDAEPLLRHLACREGTPCGRRALAALGVIASKTGDPNEALAIFEIFEKENIGSGLMPRILECHAAILSSQCRHAETITVLQDLLACPRTKAAAAARALCLMGETHEALGQPDRAIPCYKKAHGMYADCPAAAARAYIASGRVLEKLCLWESARATYQEFLAQNDADALAECAIAKERLRAIP